MASEHGTPAVIRGIGFCNFIGKTLPLSCIVYVRLVKYADHLNQDIQGILMMEQTRISDCPLRKKSCQRFYHQWVAVVIEVVKLTFFFIESNYALTKYH